MPPITRTQTGSIPPAPKPKNSSSSSQPRQREPLRRRRSPQDVTHTHPANPQDSSSEVSGSNNDPLELPRFTIDLNLPPEQRYMEVCAAFREEMRGLQGLFDEVVGGFMPWVPSGILRWVCWMLLWRVWGKEERGELRVGRNLLGSALLLDT
jgi:hypothetical protein